MVTPPTSSDPAAHPAPVGSGAPEPLSPRHARVVSLARLSRQRRARADEGRFVLDGPVLLTDAVAAGVGVDDVFVDPDTVDRPEVAAAIAVAVAAGARAWAVGGGLRGHVEPRTPHGLAAVARTPSPASLRSAATGGGPAPVHLVLVGVGDPGNVGTLLRTAEAVGAASVVLTDGSVDPWAPKVVRASAGSVLRIPVRTGPVAEVLADLGVAGVLRVATSGSEGDLPQALDLTGPVALVLGSEAHGLPPEVRPQVDVWTALPMGGRVESLNVAVAGSVLAYEVLRQRAAARAR